MTLLWMMLLPASCPAVTFEGKAGFFVPAELVVPATREAGLEELLAKQVAQDWPRKIGRAGAGRAGLAAQVQVAPAELEAGLEELLAKQFAQDWPRKIGRAGRGVG